MWQKKHEIVLLPCHPMVSLNKKSGLPLSHSANSRNFTQELSLWRNTKRMVQNMNLTHHIIEYVNCCIGAFANRFGLTLPQAYAYLRRFDGIDFLIDCYDAEHTLSIEDAVEDITAVCQNHGGKLLC